MATAEKSIQGEHGRKQNTTKRWIMKDLRRGRTSGAVLEYENFTDHGVYIQHSDSWFVNLRRILWYRKAWIHSFSLHNTISEFHRSISWHGNHSYDIICSGSDKRYCSEEWVEEMKAYRILINKGYLKKQRDGKEYLLICMICNKEVEVHHFYRQHRDIYREVIAEWSDQFLRFNF